MKIPTIRGIIDRRILLNYHIDPDVMTKYLPYPFRPKLVKGEAIAGICLIRLREVRPKGFPAMLGIASENGAHRIAVEWTETGSTKSGVYIPRRDTSSRLNSLAGGTIFPGIHHHADFNVTEKDGHYAVAFESNDGTSLSIRASETSEWNRESVFENLDSASHFFQNGAVGYSPCKTEGKYDGLELKTFTWQLSPLCVEHVQSSFFEDKKIFPPGSVKFDNALLMKSIEHEWRSLKVLEASSPQVIS